MRCRWEEKEVKEEKEEVKKVKALPRLGGTAHMHKGVVVVAREQLTLKLTRYGDRRRRFTSPDNCLISSMMMILALANDAGF